MRASRVEGEMKLRQQNERSLASARPADYGQFPPRGSEHKSAEL